MSCTSSLCLHNSVILWSAQHEHQITACVYAYGLHGVPQLPDLNTVLEVTNNDEFMLRGSSKRNERIKVPVMLKYSESRKMSILGNFSNSPEFEPGISQIAEGDQPLIA